MSMPAFERAKDLTLSRFSRELENLDKELDFLIYESDELLDTDEIGCESKLEDIFSSQFYDRLERGTDVDRFENILRLSDRLERCMGYDDLDLSDRVSRIESDMNEELFSQIMPVNREFSQEISNSFPNHSTLSF